MAENQVSFKSPQRLRKDEVQMDGAALMSQSVF